MDRAGMLAALRELIDDVSTTHRFWSDARLTSYLSEGQDKFCELTGYFRDASNFTLTLESGTAVYTIPDRVIEIIDIFDGSRRLGKILTGETYDPLTWTDFSQAQSSRPQNWRADQTTGMITLYPTPGDDEDGESLTLITWRYSLYDLAGDGPEAEVPADPEIPSRFHQAPIEWAAYKAFMHHDAETQDPVKAGDHLSAFKMYVEDGKTAFERTHRVEVRVTPNPSYVA